MSILHYENLSKDVTHLFKLDTPNTSYVLGVVDEEGYIGHFYYGKSLNDYHLESSLYIDRYPFTPSVNNRERCAFMDYFPTEYSSNGLGDYRESSIAVETKDGNFAVGINYEGYEILKGKSKLEGLPTTFGKEDEVSTLIVHCLDRVLNLKVDLIYSVFEDVDVITRSVRIINNGEDIFLTKAYSACMDMENRDFKVTTLHGSWARERHMETLSVGHQKISVESVRGETSHQDHPFIMITTPDTNDEYGEVYAMNFVYSGNFKTTVASSQFDMVRVTMGIHPDGFKWHLSTGEIFETPEVVMVYSGCGIGNMTRTYHDFYRNHLLRSPYTHKKRPILINNWEATYFDFDEEKLYSIAETASKLGIEMLVMDDGWFGKRNDDNSSLGDWKVNENKLRGGLKLLVDRVNRLGMKFGIWFEPEMVCPNSDLYREHPDWAISIRGREATRSRNQLVLDITRADVRDYVYESVAAILRSANIEYVKWDMNRQLTDIGSAELPSDRMGELYHRYVLGVYELQERLLREFPNLLLENCSGGGARFDPGMLYYSPQIWCSDDTDAIERLLIQEGTALVYPLSTMGAHVSDCPNHAVGRVTPFETRGHVALAGTFGYELDVTKIPQEDVNMIPEQVKMYHKYNDLVREGDYYRIASYSKNKIYDCYGVVSKDKSEALFTYVQVLGRPNCKSRHIYFKGLDANAVYVIDDKEYAGDVLMKAGYLVDDLHGDFKSKLIHIVRK